MSVRSHASRRVAAAVLSIAAALCVACGRPDSSPPVVAAGPPPDSFLVAFTTTRGNFTVEVHRAWAPLGVDRFYELTNLGFFDENAFYRVVPKFIVQFGAGDDPKLTVHWDSLKIGDDPRTQKNLRGTIAFAKEGSASRTHQLFINLSDNAHLDKAGFVPFGRVVDGMSVVDSIYAAYREKPEYHLMSVLGNSYLKRMFPKLDYVKTARVVR